MAVNNGAKATRIAMQQAGLAGVHTDLASVPSVRRDAQGNWEAIVATAAHSYRAAISARDGAILEWEEVSQT
jgi:hypothetical protein